MQGLHFEYGEEEINYLKSKDKKLSVVIDRLGVIKRPIRMDIFCSLIYAIIGQQISNKAQKTIVNRLDGVLGRVTPESILNSADDELQSFGLSFRKVGYMKTIAHAVYNNKIDLDSLRAKSDDEVIKELTEFKGIGVWTAEMILIHSLQRKNIFSYDDLAIINGIKKLYKHKNVNKERFDRYRKRFSPYCSIASFYFWEISSNQITI